MEEKEEEEEDDDDDNTALRVEGNAVSLRCTTDLISLPVVTKFMVQENILCVYSKRFVV